MAKTNLTKDKMYDLLADLFSKDYVVGNIAGAGGVYTEEVMCNALGYQTGYYNFEQYISEVLNGNDPE